MSIIVVMGLVGFPIFYHQSNKTMSVNIIYGVIFGVNFNRKDYEHTENEKLFYREYVMQIHFLIFSATFSTFIEKEY